MAVELHQRGSPSQSRSAPELQLTTQRKALKHLEHLNISQKSKSKQTRILKRHSTNRNAERSHSCLPVLTSVWCLTHCMVKFVFRILADLCVMQLQTIIIHLFVHHAFNVWTCLNIFLQYNVTQLHRQIELMSYIARSNSRFLGWSKNNIEQPLLSPEHKLGKSHQFRGRELVLGPPDRSLGRGCSGQGFADFCDFG